MLSGPVPESMGNCTSLHLLDLSKDDLQFMVIFQQALEAWPIWQHWIYLITTSMIMLYHYQDFEVPIWRLFGLRRIIWLESWICNLSMYHPSSIFRLPTTISQVPYLRHLQSSIWALCSLIGVKSYHWKPTYDCGCWSLARLAFVCSNYQMIWVYWDDSIVDWESEKPVSDWLVSQQVGGSHTNNNWWLGFFQSGSQFKCHDFWGFHIEPDSVRTSQNKACFNLKYSYVLAMSTTYIGLSFNALTGNIPQEIAQLVAQLLNLDLSSNMYDWRWNSLFMLLD